MLVAKFDNPAGLPHPQGKEPERQLRKSSIGWLALAAFLLGTTTLGYPWTLVDSPVSTYIGQVILEGGLPYRDAWDVRAPGVFFAYALQILLLGKTALGLRIFDALWQLATAVVLASIGFRLFGRQGAALLTGVVYLLTYFSQNFWHWAQPDTFLSLPLALSFLFFLRGLEEQRIVDWFWAAFFVGVATLFKLPFGLFGTLLLFAVVRKHGRDPRKLTSRLLALAIGLVIPLLACAAYFAAKGGLRDLLETQFVFAPAYMARIHAHVGLREFLVSFLRPTVAPVYLMILLGLGSFLLRLRNGERPVAAEGYVVAWLGVAVLVLFLHGSFLGYHYLPLFAPTALLFAECVSRLFPQFRAQRSLSRGLVFLLAVFALVAPLEKPRQHAVYTWRVLKGHVPDAPWRELGTYIRQNTEPQETIFVWGNTPNVYVQAGRRAASRFLCTAYLALRVPRLSYAAVLMEDLKSREPAFFVVATAGPITPGLPDGLESYEELPELKDWVEANYSIEKKTESYTLFRRKQADSGASLTQNPNKSEAAFRLEFSTYLGGSDEEQARDVAVDDHGNIYVTGGTVSSDFPTTAGAYQRVRSGGAAESRAVEQYDVIVTKYSPTGELLWSTRIGGPNYDRAYAIEVDRFGYVYVAGRAGKGFPVTPGAFQTEFVGGTEAPFYGHQDGFVLKLKPDGSGIVWSSYFGSSDHGIIRDLAVDEKGDVYVGAGSYGGKYKPAVAKAFLNSPRGKGDIVLAKIKGDGSGVEWARYVGGSAEEEGHPSVRVDRTGVYVAGRTDSADFPATEGAYDRTYNGGGDIFVAKFSPDGRTQIYGTFLGGSQADHASNTHNLAIDGSGNAYVTSHTFSSDFPTTPGAFDRTYNGANTGVWQNDGDFSVSKLSADGSQLLASTFVGGSSGDGPPEGVSVDRFGNLHFTGSTRSRDFPATPGAPRTEADGAVLVVLSPGFESLRFAAKVNGALRACATDSAGNVIVVGPTKAGWRHGNAPQPRYAGGSSDIVVAKFSPTPAAAKPRP